MIFDCQGCLLHRGSQEISNLYPVTMDGFGVGRAGRWGCIATSGEELKGRKETIPETAWNSNHGISPCEQYRPE